MCSVMALLSKPWYVHDIYAQSNSICTVSHVLIPQIGHSGDIELFVQVKINFERLLQCP